MAWIVRRQRMCWKETKRTPMKVHGWCMKGNEANWNTMKYMEGVGWKWMEMRTTWKGMKGHGWKGTSKVMIFCLVWLSWWKNCPSFLLYRGRRAAEGYPWRILEVGLATLWRSTANFLAMFPMLSAPMSPMSARYSLWAVLLYLAEVWKSQVGHIRREVNKYMTAHKWVRKWVG